MLPLLTFEPVELAVGLQDDYGVDATAFESVRLKLDIINVETSGRLAGVSIAIDGHPDPSRIQLATARGPFYKLKLSVTLKERPQSYPKNIRFSLSVSSPEGATPALSVDSTRMLELVGAATQRPTKGWDERQYVCIPIISGDVVLSTASKSSDKVQTVLRNIHLPNPPSASYTIIERPGLNNSTGQRLWDCAIALSCYLSLNPTSLQPQPDRDLPRSSKKPKLDPSSPSPPLTCLELGAGCALTSLVAASLLHPVDPSAVIIASDVEVTYSSTLKENLAANPTPAIQPAVLDWGRLAPADALAFLATHDGRPKEAERTLTILGSDILYNPESHQVLLETLLSFLAHDRVRRSQALIAYKPRTEGDGDFFPLAEKQGLEVVKVWEWGELGVYRLTLP